MVNPGAGHARRGHARCLRLRVRRRPRPRPRPRRRLPRPAGDRPVPAAGRREGRRLRPAQRRRRRRSASTTPARAGWACTSSTATSSATGRSGRPLPRRSCTNPPGTAGCAWWPPSTSSSRPTGTPRTRPRPDCSARTFELVPAGNRYGLPAFYELHAWLFRSNPSGMFEDWNPRVSCARSTESVLTSHHLRSRGQTSGTAGGVLGGTVAPARRPTCVAGSPTRGRPSSWTT